MSTSPTSPTSTAHRPGAPPSTGRQLLARSIRSEWIKLRTVRGAWIGLGTVVVMLVGLGAIAAAVSAGSVAGPNDGGGGNDFGQDDPLTVVLTGANFAVLLAGILGAMAGAREFGSGMIGATIAAVPRRWQVVAAKAFVLAGVVLVRRS